MTKQLQAVIDKLAAMQARAEELADSESEQTAERYADVPDNIATAIEALQEAIDALTA